MRQCKHPVIHSDPLGDLIILTSRQIYFYYKNLGKRISKSGDRTNQNQIKLNKLRLLESELKKRLDLKSKIKPILEKFQCDFEAKNNRRIKYKNDIMPVQSEYNKYIELKARISELESEIKYLKKSV